MKIKIPLVPLRALLPLLAALCFSACQRGPDDNTALIAVATNFHTTFEKLETVFETQTEFNVTQVNGATGSIYTQIMNGAPYHAFLSADEWRPQELEAQGLASGRFVYAQGELAFWSKSEEVSNLTMLDMLADPSFKPVAIANPALAPYGTAAQEVFAALGASLRNRLVVGENVGQAFALVQSGNARAGLIAKSDAQRVSGGSYMVIEPNLYAPIKQEAVLLKKGEGEPSAVAFLEFLKSPQARAIILADGYQLEMPAP